MNVRWFVIMLGIVLVQGAPAIAQQEDLGAIKTLAFLAGSWNCVVQGTAVPSGVVDHLTYDFSPDWSWMIERSDGGVKGHRYWSTQLWGYDARRKQLVAYKFDSTGVSTKSVNGWVKGQFQGTRDDNGATVAIRPISPDAFDWVTESADHSSIVTEACAR